MGPNTTQLTLGGINLFTCSTFLKSHLSQDLIKAFILADERNLYMNTSTHTGAQVGRTGQNVAQMLIPHKFMTFALDQSLNLKKKKKMFATVKFIRMLP